MPKDRVRLMRLLKTLARLGRQAKATNDQALLELLRRNPPAGWRAFLDRYSGRLLTWIRDCGFDHDQSMERFVLVCEKLAENDCRRLREIRHLGERSELVPWLRQVVQNTLISHAWSEHGRPRLLQAIKDLDDFEQQVFRRHYWRGMAASEIFADLLSKGLKIELIEVYDALATVHNALSDNSKWRLVGRLASLRSPRSLTPAHGEPALEPTSPAQDPEREALAAEVRSQLHKALVGLTPRQRLVVQLRYDQGLKVREIADLLDDSQSRIRGQIQSAMARLRAGLQTQPRSRSA